MNEKKKKSTYINASMVEPFIVNDVYSSKMLMGEDLVGEPAINLNVGTLKAGSRLPGGSHDEAEVYYIVDCGQASKVVTGTGEDGDEEICYDVKPGDIIFIPGGVFHWIDNSTCKEPFVIMTIWPKQELNGVYQDRKKAWGTSIRFLKGS